jgi:transcriptional regulator with XRE-family HTH domain
MDHEPEPGEVPGGSGDAGPGEVSGLPLLPGFREMALRRMSAERRRLVADLTAQRRSAGLSQTEIAARMGTSQSAVARLETGDADVRVSTLERYAAAIGSQVAWLARPGQGQSGPDQPGDRQPGQDQPGQDQPGQDQPGQDQPGLERADPGHPGQAQPHLMQPESTQPGSAQAQPQAELGQEYR